MFLPRNIKRSLLLLSSLSVVFLSLASFEFHKYETGITDRNSTHVLVESSEQEEREEVNFSFDLLNPVLHSVLSVTQKVSFLLNSGSHSKALSSFLAHHYTNLPPPLV